MRTLRYFILSLITLLILFPFAYLLLLSLASGWRYPEIIPQTLDLENWRHLLATDGSLLESLLLSVTISLSVAIISTALGFWVSRSLNYHPRSHSLRILSYFPYVLAPVVFAACLSYFFLKLGIFGSSTGVILAQFFIAFPYATIFFSSFWNQHTRQLEDLVATMGGNAFQAFYKVLIPMAQGMLLICFFQCFLISWFEYGLTSIIGVGKVQTLTIKVFLYIKEANFFYGAVSSCLLIFPPVILLWLNKRYVFQKPA